MVGRDLADALARRDGEACLLLEHRIHLDEAVIDRRAVCIEQHLDDAEAFVDRAEQRAVTLFAAAQRRFALALQFGDARFGRRQALVKLLQGQVFGHG